jgi:CBS domain-containing protein
MKCNEIMTYNPTCCLPTDTVDQIARLMQTENIGPVPIVENRDSKKLIGIVTDRDLALKVVGSGRDPKVTEAEDVMTRNVVSCLEDDDLQKALEAMAERQLRRIPVVDRANQIVGIISQADVATRINKPEATAEVVKEISKSNAILD